MRSRRPSRPARFWGFLFLLALAASVLSVVGVKRAKRHRQAAPPSDPDLVLVTGYCNCQKCCGWRRAWFGLGEPVYDYGPMRGRPKKVGVTATGTRARHGTIAADPKVYRFGTRLWIPGYGPGVVEDVGGAIRGRHIDLWFPTHEEARRWGVRKFRADELVR